MIEGTSTLERTATQTIEPARPGAFKRLAIIVVGAGLVAALGTGAVMVFGGSAPATVGPVVTGDRDAAWISSLERQAAQANQGSASSLRSQAEAQPPVTDKEEGLRQAEERRAALNR